MQECYLNVLHKYFQSEKEYTEAEAYLVQPLILFFANNQSQNPSHIPY